MKPFQNKRQVSKQKEFSERNRLLRNITRFTETPLLILGFLWLALLIMELLNRTNGFLNGISVGIWIMFMADFIVKFALSTSKKKYLRENILTAISLVIPAFRILRFFRLLRLFRLSRGIRLVKVLGSLNRGMNSLSTVMRRRAFGYVIAFTLIVMFVGAAGIHAFEKDMNNGFETYASSLWRTAMLIMNMGTEWPLTAEGRVLYLLIAIYSLAVLGYITATLATFFIDKDKSGKTVQTSNHKVQEILKEIQILRNEVRRLEKL